MACVGCLRNLAATIVVLLVGASTAESALIDVGNLTRDTDTGLVWLDLTLTTGTTFHEMEQRMAPGGDLEGYRHASLIEVAGLFANAGIPDVSTGGFSEANFLPSMDLLSLVGTTRPDAQFPQTSGITADVETIAPFGPGHEVAFITLCLVPVDLVCSAYWAEARADANLGPYRTDDTATAHWLVAVPEPSSGLLLAVALASLGLARRQT